MFPELSTQYFASLFKDASEWQEKSNFYGICVSSLYEKTLNP